MDSLQSTCQALLLSTQSHPVGFAALETGEGQAEQDADTLLAAVLGERERHLLELHDKLGRVTLQRRILEALVEGGDGDADGDEATPERAEALETELARARATSRLKETAVEATLVADPIIKAIYPEAAAATANAMQTQLLRLIHRRDELSWTHTNLARTLARTEQSRLEAERGHIALLRQNTALAAQLLSLIKQREQEEEAGEAGAEAGGAGREEGEARRKVREARRMWDVTRGVTQGVIAASGVDWSRDDDLRALVLACGDDDDDDDL